MPRPPGHRAATSGILAAPEQEMFSLKMMEFFQDPKEFSEPCVGDVSLGVWGVREVTLVLLLPLLHVLPAGQFISESLFHVIFLP